MPDKTGDSCSQHANSETHDISKTKSSDKLDSTQAKNTAPRSGIVLPTDFNVPLEGTKEERLEKAKCLNNV
ncbi:BgTH12-05333 [Blumeria graminis f. sp. triticale]|uniref:BgtAc-31231 n=3 Tax=Blumeria graminis TaxID=34373 RepID=A0A9X9QDC6_BLUGR|nr:hypothetical protein BGT96224_Ac31231 [Blumeria graminis f. sp. tritici 96224]CAD6502743.1 BgTH12-05333 [Blumeria graminis f. sp. triticale]VDB88190.1 BgtAc-31231 [Blumeria graminis f. sp. tritici]